MAAIRKPEESDLQSGQAAQAMRKTVTEMGEVGHSLGGGAFEFLLTACLFPFLFFGFWHGPFILLGGDFVEGSIRIALGAAALYVLLSRRNRKQLASREKQLGKATGTDALAKNAATASSQIDFSRPPMASKLFLVGFASLVCGIFSFGGFGIMAVLCGLFALRTLVLFVSIVSPGPGMNLNGDGIEVTDLIGLRTKFQWDNITSISQTRAHPLNQYLSLRHGDRRFVEILGYDSNGSERAARIPYKMLSLGADDIIALMKKAENDEPDRSSFSNATIRTGREHPECVADQQNPQSDLAALRLNQRGGFGRKGLTSTRQAQSTEA